MQKYGALWDDTCQTHQWVQAGHATPQLGQQLEQLWQQVEEGRNAVIEAHQGLLDMADGAIARVRPMTSAGASESTAIAYTGTVITPVPCHHLHRWVCSRLSHRPWVKTAHVLHLFHVSTTL